MKLASKSALLPRERTRWLAGAALLLLIASLSACSTSSSVACATPAASACPSLDGLTSFCTWAEWGCARVASCGGYFVLRDQAADARLTYYYAATTGAFVATVQEAASGGEATCVAGPSSFELPSGCAFDTLADCAPVPRDGGVTVDASSDASFSPPSSPSGSPSSQPFAAPPQPPR